MTTPINALNIRVVFRREPWAQPAEIWILTSDPVWGTEVDETALEDELARLIVDAGGKNTLTFERKLTWGGWGADGQRVLDFVLNVASDIASAALLAAVTGLYKKYVQREPRVERTCRAPGEVSEPGDEEEMASSSAAPGAAPRS